MANINCKLTPYGLSALPTLFDLRAITISEGRINYYRLVTEDTGFQGHLAKREFLNLADLELLQ